MRIIVNGRNPKAIGIIINRISNSERADESVRLVLKQCFFLLCPYTELLPERVFRTLFSTLEITSGRCTLKVIIFRFIKFTLFISVGNKLPEKLHKKNCDFFKYFLYHKKIVWNFRKFAYNNRKSLPCAHITLAFVRQTVFIILFEISPTRNKLNGLLFIHFFFFLSKI